MCVAIRASLCFVDIAGLKAARSFSVMFVYVSNFVSHWLAHGRRSVLLSYVSYEMFSLLILSAIFVLFNLSPV